MNPTPLLNRKAVRTRLLELAARRRAHKFTRVREETLVMLNARLNLACLEHVSRQPSMGKTL